MRTQTNVFNVHMSVIQVTTARWSHYPLSCWKGRLACWHHGGSQKSWPFFSLGQVLFFQCWCQLFPLWAAVLLASIHWVSRHNYPLFFFCPHSQHCWVSSLQPLAFWKPFILVSTQVWIVAGADYFSNAGSVVFVRHRIHSPPPPPFRSFLK